MALPFYREYFHITYAPRGTFSLLLYLFFLLIVVGASVVICWFTTEFWVSRLVDCGSAFGTFQNRCALHVVTVKGQEKYWSCTEAFNTEFLMGSDAYIQAFFSVSEGKGRATELLISVPIGDMAANIYQNPEDLPEDVELDGIQSITFIPSIAYSASGSSYKVNQLAAPQLHYQRSIAYQPSGVDNSANSFSGGPLCVHSEYNIQFSPDSLDESPSCRQQDVILNAALSDFLEFSSFCSPTSRTVSLSRLRERTGSLKLLDMNDVTNNIGQDLSLLNAFTWRITLHFPETCMPHTPQVGYSLKYAYIQFITLAWGLHWVIWVLRGILATNGLIDLNAHYQTRLTGSRERLKN